MMAGKVADSTGAKLPPGTPADGGVIGMIGTWRHGLEPALPIEAGRHGRRLLGPVGKTGPAISARVGPGVNIVDITYCTVPYPFAGKADVLAGVSEVTELGSDAGLAGGFGDNAGLVDCAAEGLFTVEVFTLGDYGQVNYSMRMVRRGDEDGVNVFLIEHLIIVMVGRAGLAVLFSDQVDGGFQARSATIVEHAIIAQLVDVTQGGDVDVGLVEKLLHVDDALAARSNDGDVNLFARCDVAGPAEHVARYNGESRGRGEATQKIPPGNPLLYVNGIGFLGFHILFPFCVHLYFSDC